MGVSDPDSNGDNRLANGQFGLGNTANPNGRPKGVRHKIADSFLEIVAEHVAKHGDEFLSALMKEKPELYCEVIFRSMPNGPVSARHEQITISRSVALLGEAFGQGAESSAEDTLPN